MKGPTLKRAAQSEPTPLFAAARHRIKPRRATHTNSAADWIPRGECVLSSRRPFVERSPASWTYFAVESSDWGRGGWGVVVTGRVRTDVGFVRSRNFVQWGGCVLDAARANIPAGPLFFGGGVGGEETRACPRSPPFFHVH